MLGRWSRLSFWGKQTHSLFSGANLPSGGEGSDRDCTSWAWYFASHYLQSLFVPQSTKNTKMKESWWWQLPGWGCRFKVYFIGFWHVFFWHVHPEGRGVSRSDLWSSMQHVAATSKIWNKKSSTHDARNMSWKTNDWRLFVLWGWLSMLVLRCKFITTSHHFTEKNTTSGLVREVIHPNFPNISEMCRLVECDLWFTQIVLSSRFNDALELANQGVGNDT